jgi:hypothetical protein
MKSHGPLINGWEMRSEEVRNGLQVVGGIGENASGVYEARVTSISFELDNKRDMAKWRYAPAKV